MSLSSAEGWSTGAGAGGSGEDSVPNMGTSGLKGSVTPGTPAARGGTPGTPAARGGTPGTPGVATVGAPVSRGVGAAWAGGSPATDTDSGGAAGYSSSPSGILAVGRGEDEHHWSFR